MCQHGSVERQRTSDDDDVEIMIVSNIAQHFKGNGCHFG
jgi:hypothetical protein